MLQGWCRDRLHWQMLLHRPCTLHSLSLPLFLSHPGKGKDDLFVFAFYLESMLRHQAMSQWFGGCCELCSCSVHAQFCRLGWAITMASFIYPTHWRPLRSIKRNIYISESAPLTQINSTQQTKGVEDVIKFVKWRGSNEHFFVFFLKTSFF